MYAEKLQEKLKVDMRFDEALQRFSNVSTKELIEDIPQVKGKAYPFVKWAGGKRAILKELLSRLPKNFNNYYEVFVGGGALYFEIYKHLKHAYLSDNNLDLALTYNVIKKDPEPLITLLKSYTKKHSDEYYYKIRDKHLLQDPVEISARFIYLNRTCYNGLYRTNKKGEFNVPVGRYINPDIVREDNLRACHKALKHATIEFRDFETVTPEKNDFVYIDPPYHPTNEQSFTKYTKSDFTEKDQVRLRDYILELHKKGVKVMISNSKTGFIENLFNNKVFNINIVNAPRNVNCKSDKRKPVEEYLITNYRDYETRWIDSKLYGKDS